MSGERCEEEAEERRVRSVHPLVRRAGGLRGVPGCAWLICNRPTALIRRRRRSLGYRLLRPTCFLHPTSSTAELCSSSRYAGLGASSSGPRATATRLMPNSAWPLGRHSL